MSLYVVLLEKKDTLHPSSFKQLAKLPCSHYQSWISMGHFDVVYTYKIQDNNNFFISIQNNNQKTAEINNRTHYLHPLYLITERCDDKFWDHFDTPFMAISRIHFSSSTGVRALFHKTETELQTKSSDHDSDFSYKLYQTIELSDAILVIKGYNLQKILNFSMHLREYEQIGKVYTHCCINRDILMNCDNDLSWRKSKDIIPLCSMRFSVSSPLKAKKIIENFKEDNPEFDIFSVTGVDDIVIKKENLPTVELMNLYRNWLFMNEDFSLAFSSIITRLGDEYEGYNGTDTPDSCNKKLIQKCYSLMEKSESIVNRYATPGPAWAHPTAELAAILFRMSKTPILDEFVYLMLPGINAFLDRIQNNYSLSDDTCNLFVESLTNFMEHIMRTEGQLTHNPEFRPIIYDIPIALLEYILAFLERTTNILKAGENDGQFSFFLIPRLCTRIKAQELFAPIASCPGLVLVTLPFSMLYDLSAVQTALCHEVSHFVGEKCRSRTDRRKRYAHSVAALIARDLFKTNHPAVIRQLYFTIRGIINTKNTMREMKNETENWAKLLYTNAEYQQSVISDVIRRPDCMMDALPYFPSALDNSAQFSGFVQTLNDISILFRECFADLCMLYLLPIESKKYIDTLIEDLNTHSHTAKLHYEQFAIRAYVVLVASNRFNTESSFFDSKEKNNNVLYPLIIKLDTAITNKTNINENRIPISAIIDLINYLKECWSQLSNSINNTAKASINAMYHINNSSTVDYNQFLTQIDNYRNDQLK